jgi:hypothetical protein
LIQIRRNQIKINDPNVIFCINMVNSNPSIAFNLNT